MPVCVMFHVMLPIIVGSKPAPIIVPVESDVAPIHVPLSVDDAVGAVAADIMPVDVEEPPAHATETAAAAMAAKK